MKSILAINNLYLKIFLSNRNRIILVISILLIMFLMVLNLRLGFDESLFILMDSTYMEYYFSNSISQILLINCIMIPLMILPETKFEIRCLNEIIIVAKNETYLKTAKLLTILQLSFFISMIESLFLLVLPVSLYPYVNITYHYLLTIIYIFLFTLFVSVLSFLLVKVTKSFLVCSIPIVCYILIDVIGNMTGIFIFGSFSSYCLNSISSILFMITYILIVVVLIFKSKNKKTKKIKKTLTK